MQFLKAFFFGVLEGVTEWLPISSTGHLILLERLVRFEVTPAFFELFEVLIQLGAILAVLLLFWRKLNPVARGKSKKERRDTLALWGKVLLATLPSAAVGLLLDDWLNEHLYNALTVSVALVLYGIFFLLPQRRRQCEIGVQEIKPSTALGIGCFQMLALIPGTSRSGATILGGILLGLPRGTAAEFSFFLAIPTMLGAGGLKAVKFFLEGNTLSQSEVLLLLIGAATAFAVSLAVIRFLLDFVRRHSFAAFGIYRILLGAAVFLSTVL